ncbi:hypothetical protein CC80DRAFT_149063 [Byssothecium circinans]|uniref:Uncharacterized protein n=1 Tax=Byssothecium circinans TaxID=147558 RepID=A0A6A5TMK3_9PLEO|nr:hypothetical protein CC80DRAFT_149063 [Byssothecium circinans]
MKKASVVLRDFAFEAHRECFLRLWPSLNFTLVWKAFLMYIELYLLGTASLICRSTFSCSLPASTILRLAICLRFISWASANIYSLFSFFGLRIFLPNLFLTYRWKIWGIYRAS